MMNTKRKNKKYQSGVALLFSMIVSSILLTIALSVLNTAVKELTFSTSAKDSNNSFFAADTGVECALTNDKTGNTVFADPNGGEPANVFVNCQGRQIPYQGGYPVFTFVLKDLGTNGRSCARVTLVKNPDTGETKVTSKGYNLGGDGECDQTGLHSTERVIEVNY